jgi:hypothetical protein
MRSDGEGRENVMSEEEMRAELDRLEKARQDGAVLIALFLAEAGGVVHVTDAKLRAVDGKALLRDVHPDGSMTFRLTDVPGLAAV